MQSGIPAKKRKTIAFTDNRTEVNEKSQTVQPQYGWMV